MFASDEPSSASCLYRWAHAQGEFSATIAYSIYAWMLLLSPDAYAKS